MTNDLVSPSDLTGFPGAPFSDDVVDAAVASLRAYAGWHIAPSRTETLTVDSDGGDRLTLPSLHVTAVTEVRNVYSADSPSEITGFRWAKAGILALYCGWPCGFQSVEVDLTHGYDTVPVELLASLAAACAVGSLTGVASRSIGPFSESYSSSSGSASFFSSDPAASRYALPPRP